MMKHGTCCFAGHRDTPQSVYPALEAAVERHIVEYGVEEFLVGQYGNFDQMAIQAVNAARERHPQIKLKLMIPYLPEPGWWASICKGVDYLVYPACLESGPRRSAIPRLNRIMVHNSDYVIAYVTRDRGGAAKTLEAAHALEFQGALTVLNLGT